MAEGLCVAVRADKEKKILEADVAFQSLIPKDRLYALEEHIRLSYHLASVRLRPKYDAGLFSNAYLEEVFKEAGIRGAITRGFFPEYTVMVKDTDMTIDVSQNRGGFEMMIASSAPSVMSDIIYEEFKIRYNITLNRCELEEDPFEQEREERRTTIVNAAVEQQSIPRDIPQDSSAYRADYQPTYTRGDGERERPDKSEVSKQLAGKISSLCEQDALNDEVSPGVYKIGRYEFDCSQPTALYGEAFEPHPIPIRNIKSELKIVCVVGITFGIDSRELRGKNKTIVSFYITDGDSTVKVKAILPNEEASELLGIKDGTVAAVQGSIKIDLYETDYQLSPKAIVKVKRVYRADNAPEKRVELHLHTMMSMLDATIPPDVAVETAARWGHKAVAITDHGNVQGFPEAMIAKEKLAKNGTDIKVIYGMEGYFIDDTAKALYGGESGSFDDEFTVFDIETTGLSVQTCRIIEIGAVKVKGGEVLEKFNTFVDPECEIPPNITKLTGITNEMVQGAPSESEAVGKFLEFSGSRMLVAHNASFDISFILSASGRCGFDFKPVYLDTVSMSRYANPELKNHKLDTVAEYFGLGDFNHHRASDDAEMLALIFFKMIDKVQQEGVETIEQMNEAMSTGTSHSRQRPNHIILLVKNKVGLKNLYKLISKSNLEYYYRKPQIPKSVLNEFREGLVVGSACCAGELYRAILDGKPESELESIASYYDYLEIQPLSNNQFLVKEQKVSSYDQLKAFNLKIIKLGQKLNKPVCATTDAHVLNKEDEIGKRIIYHGKKMKDSDDDIGVYFRTTEEMLAEFDYLDEKTRREVVIDNPNMIADMIEEVRPIPKGNYPPKIDGADEELTSLCYSNMKRIYGDPAPKIVSDRLEKELTSIIKHGFGVLYVIAEKLVRNSESKGYLVGSRGSVGSSFVATMASITEVNPLPPHYLCPKCKHSEFFTNGEVGSGFDLPEKICPECGEKMRRDGHDIPFETFLGFKGDKSPDIDLNFSGDVQGDAHKYTEVLFGAENVFRAGTLGTLADKTAYGLYVMKYIEDNNIPLRAAEVQHLVNMIVGCKRTTGQHPGGIIVVPREYDVYDFTPVQHPADDPKSDIVTTHFAFEYLHDTILKLDILGHDVPTKYKVLERYTHTNILDTPLTDPKVLKLMTSCEPLGISPSDIDVSTNPNGKPLSSGTFALPELGTKFVRQMLEDAQPKCFSDLLQISGLSHGTNVWLDNAQTLIKNGTCTISEVIGTRDSIMVYLMHKGVEPSMAFTIMEYVRKGNKPPKNLKEEHFAAMRAANVPEWYIESCLKIKYMFPKAHAAAYIISALRLGYYKVYHPLEFYAAYFTVAPEGFNAELALKGKSSLRASMREYESTKDTSAKENEEYGANQITLEAVCRGIKFLPVKLGKSHEKDFLPEDGKIRLPFSSLPGLGETAAFNITNACRENEIYCIAELQQYAGVSKAVMQILRSNGVLEGMDETNQISMFSGMNGF